MTVLDSVRAMGRGRSGGPAASGWATGSSIVATAADTPTTKPAKFGRLKQADIAWVCEQLAVTQDAGIPLFKALGLLANMRKGTGLGRRMSAMQDQLGEGLSIGEILRANEKDWGQLIGALVAAGEASGDLGGAFERCAELVNTRLRLRRKIRTAMMYPLVVIAVTFILVATLLIVVVPRFEEIYSSLGAELPSVTTAVIAFAGQVPAIAAVMVAIAAVVFVILRRAKTDRSLKRRLDRIKLRIPVVGNLLAKGVQSRVASTMGVLLAAGVPLLDVLNFAAASAGSAPVEDAFATVRQQVADGATFATALAETGEFPDMLVQLVSVGEESGTLPTMMDRYAKRTSEEVEQAATSITTLVEPLMMVMVGGVVGVFLLALYLPIISLSSAIK